MKTNTANIRIRRREGRNVFVFHRDGSDLFELEEIPPRFVDPREWAEPMGGPEPPPLPASASKEDERWARTSITGLRRKLGGS